MTDGIKLVSLQIKNFMSISDVEVKPGKVTQIIGNNNQGKTSIIKALEFAINGSNDFNLIQHGASEAEVIVELSDSTNIRRRINESGKQTLEVKREGFKAPSPQAYLDGLFKSSLFNPIELLDEKKRTEALLTAIDIKLSPEILSERLGVKPEELPPLNYTDHGLSVIDQAHKFYYQRRAEANRDLDNKKRKLDQYSETIPKESQCFIPLEEANAKLNELLICHESISQEMNKEFNTETIRKGIEERIEQLKIGISNKKKDIAKIENEILSIENSIVELTGRLPESSNKLPELTVQMKTIEESINQAKIEVEKSRAGEAVKKQELMVKAIESEYLEAKSLTDKLTEIVNKLRSGLKKELVAESDLPVKGLSYDGDEFYLDGSSINNLSSSKAMVLAVGIARKLSKKVKLICIDGAERLDQETYSKLREEIKDDGFSYFVTKVGENFQFNGDEVIRMEHGSNIIQ